MSKRIALWVALLCLSLAATLGCESTPDSSPGIKNPPPPPSRTPTDLRHAPNAGVRPMSDEMSKEEAAELLGGGAPSDTEPKSEAPEEAEDGEAKSE